MKVNVNNKLIELKEPARILSIIDNKDYRYGAARVNNRLRELDYIISDDCNIELLDLTDSSVSTIYQSTLRYTILMAFRNIYPNVRIVFNYSVSRSIFASVSGLGRPFNASDLKLIEEELERLILADLPIKRYSISKEEANAYYKSVNLEDKVRILKYRKEDTVHVYQCQNYKNYMFGYMLPSTGYLKSYNLRLYAPGFLITYPRAECGGKLPEFQDEKVFRNALVEANNWSYISKAGYISQMNEIVLSGNALEFINICEAKHNSQLVTLGKKIQNSIDSVKLIAVAGPSSSGKTTFTNRLRIQLKSLGIDPLMISIDDFYNKPSMAPLDENGKPDLEHIDALDRALFDQTIYKLINGEEVRLPKYNFAKSERTFKEPIKLKGKQPILIEGIHALNDMLTPSIAEEYKFKIYIAPLVQYHIDDHNPISISDIRLIRRMVRDHQYRNTDCERTLSSWQSVRNGEFKWIYPYQNSADFVYNSELSYELCVLKKHAIPLLESVKDDSPNYISANRLLKFLKYFENISDKWIPCNSIIREFIGDSIFYTEDKI